jgi:hypothetical protein
MRVQVHIRTYDTIPTDLAGEMQKWQEFVRGQGYTVHLRDDNVGDEVSVHMKDTPDDFPTVIVEGASRTVLLDRTVGRVVQALAEHSDNLMVGVGKMPFAEPGAPPNGGPATPPGDSGASERPPSVS